MSKQCFFCKNEAIDGEVECIDCKPIKSPWVDPTQIEMDVDPASKFINGVTRHGNIFFSCPVISQVTNNLWQGGCQQGLVLPRNIDHLVSLYPWEQYTVEHELKSNLTVRMYDDSQGPDTELVLSIARWINLCRQTGTVLVHCQAGLNRSGMLTATALMLDGMSAKEAIDLLQEKRSDAVLCNRTFVRWLMELEDELSEYGER